MRIEETPIGTEVQTADGPITLTDDIAIIRKDGVMCVSARMYEIIRKKVPLGVRNAEVST